MKKKCLYICIGIICSIALAFGIYFIFIEVKIKEFTSMDLTEIKTEGNFIRLRDGVYFSLILLNSYFVKLFEKLNFN